MFFCATLIQIQYIPRNIHTVFALLCFVVVIHWLLFPYPSDLLHWHCGNLTIAPVPAKQPWWIWINTSFEFIMNDYITTTKQGTTNRVHISWDIMYLSLLWQGLSVSSKVISLVYNSNLSVYLVCHFKILYSKVVCSVMNCCDSYVHSIRCILREQSYWIDHILFIFTQPMHDTSDRSDTHCYNL